MSDNDDYYEEHKSVQALTLYEALVQLSMFVESHKQQETLTTDQERTARTAVECTFALLRDSYDALGLTHDSIEATQAELYQQFGWFQS